MAFVYNGTTVTSVVFNGTTIDTVYFNGTEVFSSFNPILFDTDGSGSTENTSFVTGFNTGGSNAVTENFYDSSLSSYSTRLNVPGITGVSEIGWVTDVTVDLTGYSSLEVTWRQAGTANNNNSSRLVVSTNKTADSNTFDARATAINTFSLTTTSLDVSGLSGSYYIRVHARDNSSFSSITSTLYVYKIELIP